MLYKYVSASNAEEALSRINFYCEERSFFASRPTSFNDPFEFKIAIDLEGSEEIVRERYLLENNGKTNDDFEEWRAAIGPNHGWWLSQETRKTLLSQCGVLCLSKIDDNHLMWSHYASCHRGFCVGFDETALQRVEGVCGYGLVSYQVAAPQFRFYLVLHPIPGNEGMS